VTSILAGVFFPIRGTDQLDRGCAVIVLVAAVVYGLSVQAKRSVVLPDAATGQSNQQQGASLAGAPATSR
jgi:hypothetical protein